MGYFASTLIYGQGRDKNITDIAHFIRRFKFFPLFGCAGGCVSRFIGMMSLWPVFQHFTSSVANRAYNINGGETLIVR